MVSSNSKVPFRTIPKTPPLFVDYLEGGSKSEAFFPHHFLKSAAFQSVAGDLPVTTEHRRQIVSALRRQNERFGLTPAVAQNLERLSETDCYAVVTGQQVGLLTGPCYTVYKALSTIKLARYLTDQGIKTVPIFWMETYDHDLEEINHVLLLDAQSQNVTKLHLDFDPAAQGQSVGKIRLGSGLAGYLETVRAQLPSGSEFTNETIALIERCYRPEATIGDAFGSMMTQLLGDFGLILFDPSDPSLGNLTQTVFNWAFHNCDRLGAEMSRSTEAIQAAGFKPQIKLEPESTFVFYSGGQYRKLLLRDGNRVWLKGGEMEWTLHEAQALAHNQPDKLSASVALRPLLQDHLLPTIAYVGGPSEITYFAQLTGAYQMMGRPMPVLVPRASFTVLTHKASKILSKYSMNFISVFEGDERLTAETFERFVSGETAAEFEGLVEEINRRLDHVKPHIELADPTLGSALENARQKLLYQVNHLKTRFIHAEERRNEKVVQSIEALVNLLYPHKNLQERELSICYFLSRYGKAFLGELLDVADALPNQHSLLVMDSN